jgi:hypothetical protein
MMSANNWSDKGGFGKFMLALRGSANTWFDSQMTQIKWTIIQPLFMAEFAIESNDKLILDGLAHLAMKNSKNIRDYFGRLNKTNMIILDAHKSYTLVLQSLVPDGNNHIDAAVMDKYVAAREEAL